MAPWISMSMLLAAAQFSHAQCDAPASLWLTPPQTSTALVLKWTPVSNATQYQIRYWETANPDDKTIVDNCGPIPFTLRGLRKNTQYKIEIRTKCGGSTSAWSAAINGVTSYSSGSCNNIPAGVLVNTAGSNILISWTSYGSHTLRYRMGNSGDWMVPPGAISLLSSPYSIGGVAPGTYQVEIKRNCSATSGLYKQYTVSTASTCATPAAPSISSAVTSALIDLLAVSGGLGYNVEYRQGVTGNWTNGGINVPASSYLLNPPLTHSTVYQVQIQAICSSGNSGFSPPVTFTTEPELAGPCLSNKNAGKNMSSNDIMLLNSKLNRPSAFSFGSMIGVNDGGLIFRSFQNEQENQIFELTPQLRNFHTMDEDFNISPGSYDQNIKPKDTNPEGTPAHTARHKSFYSKYREHGFTNITGATEILQYWPQSWKEKIYKESDWSNSGPSGIMNSFENYTKTYIDQFAPVNGVGIQMLVSNFQVGNELWDYPVKADYHSLLIGARNAFVSKYGPKAHGGWRMKLVAGAFQAYRESHCASFLRDFSNCSGALERHDFIGDYLELTNCDVLKDLDAIDVHPYSFKSGTTQWTHPEDPNSEALQIINLAAWLDANQNNSTGVLQNTRLWSTEFGYDSHPTVGVGEKTQSNYLLRGLFLHSRYHYEKVFFYNAFDSASEGAPGYDGLYGTSGFWRQGKNGVWSSPLEIYGASPKPAWFGMLDMKTRFGDHVFYKALAEDAEAYVILIAKPDGTDPYLVFWSPQQTNDANIQENIPVMINLQWTGVFPAEYTVATTMAQNFAESAAPGQTFEAVTNPMCGSITLQNIRRSPAFIRLESCNACPNITNPGAIEVPNPNSGNSPFDPASINSTAAASGGSGGFVEYQWQQSADNINFSDISGATGLSFNPPSLTQTTHYRRGAKRSICTGFMYTPALVITVVSSTCPNIGSFRRISHTMSGCNPSGDNYYEIEVDQINLNEQITLTNLPTNGINIPMCMLNGIAMTPTTFFANIHFVDNSTLNWQIKSSNGSTQTLRLYYCWSNVYPEPVGNTVATSLCSGQSSSCTEGPGLTDPEIGEREEPNGIHPLQPFQFTVAPNPGTDHLMLRYAGAPAPHAILRIMTVTGQCFSTQTLTDLENQQQWEINTLDLPPGIYFLCLKTGLDVKWVVWERI
ncbi:MAG: fibronectin type III domain-containing protein [Saprospiraceae bacterium]|nr:fibronectin type III domain-containing protein [Saprospiraceae bacterium]